MTIKTYGKKKNESYAQENKNVLRERLKAGVLLPAHTTGHGYKTSSVIQRYTTHTHVHTTIQQHSHSISLSNVHKITQSHCFKTTQNNKQHNTMYRNCFYHRIQKNAQYTQQQESRLTHTAINTNQIHSETVIN